MNAVVVMAAVCLYFLLFIAAAVTARDGNDLLDWVAVFFLYIPLTALWLWETFGP